MTTDAFRNLGGMDEIPDALRELEGRIQVRV